MPADQVAVQVVGRAADFDDVEAGRKFRQWRIRREQDSRGADDAAALRRA